MVLDECGLITRPTYLSKVDYSTKTGNLIKLPIRPTNGLMLLSRQNSPG